MKFFKPTWKKLLIAFILTIWPYVASFIYILLANDGDLRSDPIVQFSFWFHTWYWSPLYPIVQHIPDAKPNPFWQSNTFYFFVYPLVRFSIRYIMVCVIVYFANKLVKKHSNGRQKITQTGNTTKG